MTRLSFWGVAAVCAATACDHRALIAQTDAAPDAPSDGACNGPVRGHLDGLPLELPLAYYTISVATGCWPDVHPPVYHIDLAFAPAAQSQSCGADHPRWFFVHQGIRISVPFRESQASVTGDYRRGLARYDRATGNVALAAARPPLPDGSGYAPSVEIKGCAELLLERRIPEGHGPWAAVGRVGGRFSARYCRGMDPTAELCWTASASGWGGSSSAARP